MTTSLPMESLLALLLVASATAVIVKWVRVPLSSGTGSRRAFYRHIQSASAHLDDT